MPTSLPLLILSGAYVLSTASVCAFQSGSASSLVGAIGTPTWSCMKQPTIATRKRTAMFQSIRSDEQIAMKVDQVEIYNDDGEEVDIQIDLENMEDDDTNEYYSSEDGTEEDKDDKSRSKNLIECSASIMLPFPEDVAFDAFSDLTRQPSWCKYLHSVEYIGLVDDFDKEDKTNNNNIPLRKSKWTVGVKGLKFSWTSNDTKILRPKRIEWESTSGMKNMGSVEFVPQNSSSPSSVTTETKMTLYFTYVAPRVVSSLFRRSGKVRKYTEDVLLMNMLTDFRDIVMEENL